VREIESPAGALVVKSPHANALLAWLGRRAIRREAQVYDRLRGVVGVPASFGLADSRHLALERVEGPTLRQAAATLTDRPRFFAQLLETIRAMHAAGVAHGDLKRKENTLVGPGETPWIIDFGVACIRKAPAGGLSQRRFELMRQMDLNAYIKLKYSRTGETMSTQDAALFRPLLIERWARRARAPWQFLTLRKTRKRRRAETTRRPPR